VTAMSEERAIAESIMPEKAIVLVENLEGLIN
jgi:hypothetical protein